MKYFYIVLIIFSISLLFCQNWENISPLPSNEYLLFGNFVSAEEGWVLQYGRYVANEIYYTQDGGSNWDVIYTLEDSLEYFTSFQMVDDCFGWGTKVWRNNHHPYNRIISYLRTNNGGNDWIDMTEYIPDLDVIEAFYFFNQDIGFFAGGIDPDDHSAKIYKTIDGGYNWYLTETPPIYYEYPNLVTYQVIDFFFLDEYHGWAACAAWVDAGLTISTTDGGNTWESGMQAGPPNAYNIHFISPNKGGVACRNTAFTYIAITEDNFNSISFDYDNSNWNQLARAICFQNDSTIWITGEPGIINRSINSGESFDVYQVVNSSLETIEFHENTGYIYGHNNNLLKYTDPVYSNFEVETQNNDFNLSIYPNPFNPSTEISFSIPEFNKIELTIYNLKGEIVKKLLNEFVSPCDFSITWDSRDNQGNKLSSGLYICELNTSKNSEYKKLILIK
ncbi:MAG: hypothetical protein APR54_06355 [Candidatus Cloacimonas sp. SDB]|nr:MAG: hypothetical protein APR54_06355 [Candidatus Cloacimonas sp. SDB]